MVVGCSEMDEDALRQIIEDLDDAVGALYDTLEDYNGARGSYAPLDVDKVMNKLYSILHRFWKLIDYQYWNVIDDQNDENLDS